MSAPDRIGEYEIVGELGRGAMGVVFRARKASIPDREVALKEVPVGIGGEDRDRRLREAKALTRIQSLHIVSLLDVFEAPERASLCIVMERLESETLRDRLTAAAGPLDADVAIGIADGILDALEAAHAAVGDDGEPSPIVHRDMKPENVGYAKWRGEELVKVMDFGIAAAGGADAKAVATAFTPAYAAPEVLLGEPATPAADLFAAGLVIWEMLVGRHPLADARGKLPAPAIVQARLAQEPVPPIPDHLLPRIPEGLVDLVRDLCQRDPHLRPNAHEARERLARSRGGAPGISGIRPAGAIRREVAAPPAAARRSSRGLVLAVGLVLVGGAGALALVLGPPEDVAVPVTAAPFTVAPPITAAPATAAPIVNVDLGNDVPQVDVAAEALAPGSYRCRLSEGASVGCTLARTGGTDDLPSYRLLTMGGDVSIDGTLARLGGTAYRFEGRFSTPTSRSAGPATGELQSDARGTTLAGTLSAPGPVRFELRR
jgi:hypothetical protein